MLVPLFAKLFYDSRAATEDQNNKARLSVILDSIDAIKAKAESKSKFFCETHKLFVLNGLEGFKLCKSTAKDTDPLIVYEGELTGRSVLVYFQGGYRTYWSREYWKSHPLYKHFSRVEINKKGSGVDP